MEYAARLGALVERLFREARRDERRFPALALQALAELPPSELRYEDALRWALTTPRLPRQDDIAARFGEPPLTLYYGEGFHISLLFWLDGTTAIHQHGFSGAFHVLSGSSVHNLYDFKRGERVNSRLHLGELRLARAELLARGDSRPIYVGEQMIHSLFHLDRPSITLIVRTIKEEDARPQFAYYRPGIALDPFYAPDPLQRRLQCLRVMLQLEHPAYLPSLKEYLLDADLETALRVVLSQTPPQALYEPLLELLDELRPRFGAPWEQAKVAFEGSLREADIVQRRQRIKDPDHRFFLALLLNLPNRRTIFDFVQRRYQRDPIEVILGWVEALSQGPAGAEGPNALDIDFDRASLLVFKALLEGLSLPEVKARLAEEFAGVEEEEEALRELCEAFEGSPFFRPLFVGTGANF
jgi:hypothetical protein